jgi:predicted transcriptional regulator
VNALTGDRIVLQEFVRDVAGSARLEVLRALDQQQMTPSDMDNQGQLGRQTASEHLSELTALGLTKPAGEGGGYELTAGGKVVLDAFNGCLEDVEREVLTSLTESAHSLDVLKRISVSPSRPADLADDDTDSPSRSTVQRILGRFESENLIKKEAGRYGITSAGGRVLAGYDELATVIEQVMEKAAWFQRLDSHYSDMPVRGLDEATLYVSSPENPGVFLTKALDLCDPELTRFRVLTPIFNAELFRAYGELWESGLEGEAIVDSALYERLLEDGMETYLDDSAFPRSEFYRLDETVSIGIAIYDESHVAIGGYNEVGQGTHIAMIVSSNDSLVDWGTELFESFLDRAELIFFRATG